MIKYLFAFAIMLFASTFVIAEEDENVGKIDSVNPEYLHVVIDDSLYTFALNVKVFDVKGRPVNRYALKQGAQVRYDFNRSAKGEKQLSNVWIVSESGK